MPLVRKRKSRRINGFAAVRFVYEITYDLRTSRFFSTPKDTSFESSCPCPCLALSAPFPRPWSCHRLDLHFALAMPLSSPSLCLARCPRLAPCLVPRALCLCTCPCSCPCPLPFAPCPPFLFPSCALPCLLAFLHLVVRPLSFVLLCW